MALFFGLSRKCNYLEVGQVVCGSILGLFFDVSTSVETSSYECGDRVRRTHQRQSTLEPSLSSPDCSLKRPDDVIQAGRKKKGGGLSRLTLRNSHFCYSQFASFA